MVRMELRKNQHRDEGVGCNERAFSARGFPDCGKAGLVGNRAAVVKAGHDGQGRHRAKRSISRRIVYCAFDAVSVGRVSLAGPVLVSTGRVEIGQGVLTAMLQIAAD
jgi:hypothetical protein